VLGTNFRAAGILEYHCSAKPLNPFDIQNCVASLVCQLGVSPPKHQTSQGILILRLGQDGWRGTISVEHFMNVYRDLRRQGLLAMIVRACPQSGVFRISRRRWAAA